MASVDVVEVFCVCVKACLAAQRYLMHELLRVQDMAADMRDRVDDVTRTHTRTCASNTALSQQQQQQHAQQQQHGRDTFMQAATTAASSSSSSPCVLSLPLCDRQRLLHALTRAVAVREKGILTYKQAGSASHDLVTTADVLTQAVLLRALRRAFPDEPFTIVAEEEDDEDEHDEQHNTRATTACAHDTLSQHVTRCLAVYYDTQTRISHERALRAHIAQSSRLHKAHNDDNDDNDSTHKSRRRQGQQQQHDGRAGDDDDAGAVVLRADSVQALRTRLSLYIDPIDGTGCLVDGALDAPLTLVGVALDGVPVAGVANRVFCYPVVATTTTTTTNAHTTTTTPTTAVRAHGGEGSATTRTAAHANDDNDSSSGGGDGDMVHSLSYVWHVPAHDNDSNSSNNDNKSDRDALAAHTTPFLVYEGARVTLCSGCTTPACLAPRCTRHRSTTTTAATSSSSSRVLTVCQSSTTRASALQALQQRLAPARVCLARGAGNKRQLLVRHMLLLQQQQQQQQQPSSSPCVSSHSLEHVDATTTAATGAAADTATSSSSSTMVAARDGCDVFVCPADTLHKWDCCAPHAFLRALGGDAYTHDGRPLRYDVVSRDRTTAAAPAAAGGDGESVCDRHVPSHAQTRRRGAAAATVVHEAQSALPDGVIAVTRDAAREVARRMGWSCAADDETTATRNVAPVVVPSSL